MHHVTHIVFSILLINIFVSILAQNNSNNIIESVKINDIADALILILGLNTNASNVSRIEELKEKLKKIDNYAIDKEKFALLLTNVTMETNLNETNFFRSLSEDDDFKFLLKTEPKNLYLQLKEKINRDDVLRILAERGKNSKIVKSARKAMGEDYFGSIKKDEILDVVVDKMLAEKPNDKHKYELKANESIYWDPQGELEDLKEFHRHDGRRIFKGERTTVRYYPFMVSVHVMGRFWCGGTVYWNDLVLTSAACLQLMHNNRFFRENPKVLQVRVGSNHSRIGGDVIDALEVYFHPGYNPRTLRNNIAVIRLRRHLSFNYHRTPKILQISHNPNTVAPTAEVLLLGWGVTKMSQKLSYEPVYLQKKFLPVYPNSFCKEVYGDKFITQTMFCAGTFTTGEGACDHDAGGPAVLAGQLVGIISFGPAVCGYPNAPTVFTLVGAFADWIETVNETMPGYYRGRIRTTTSTRKPIFQYLGTMFHDENAQTEHVDMEKMLYHKDKLLSGGHGGGGEGGGGVGGGGVGDGGVGGGDVGGGGVGGDGKGDGGHGGGGGDGEIEETTAEPTEAATEAATDAPAELPGLRLLKNQFSDEDSWGDKK